MDNIIDFNRYKDKKLEAHKIPFFTKNAIITLKTEEGKMKYIVIANIVMRGKQIIAMNRLDKDEENIGIAEAVIENNKVKNIQKITEEEFAEASKHFKQIIKNIGESNN
ncbi:hypothetical protein CIB95_12700 [Lottiidibacillus patelloidae]|uniref:Uncharacterized protein n=1 Tax=Lottiidibacillus patelloidae TaxID=2670334 RepID=A0A263BSX1_9BACI|nr:hypothetical protein [Lottiidibacillus patelloidae]OZM56276.1 hypothetical protein CIB95_12700 [Lottiidibacillus patelloidae]